MACPNCDHSMHQVSGPMMEARMTDLAAEHILEIFNERAAIMEFDANMPRAEAERAAWLDMRKLYGIFKMPEEMQKLLKK